MFTKMPVFKKPSQEACDARDWDTQKQCQFLAAADAGAITQPAGFATPPKTLKDAQHMLYKKTHNAVELNFMKDMKKLSVLAVAQMKRGEDPLNRLIMKALPSATQVQELTCPYVGLQIAYTQVMRPVYRGIVISADDTHGTVLFLSLIHI